MGRMKKILLMIAAVVLVGCSNKEESIAKPKFVDTQLHGIIQLDKVVKFYWVEKGDRLPYNNQFEAAWTGYYMLGPEDEFLGCAGAGGAMEEIDTVKRFLGE